MAIPAVTTNWFGDVVSHPRVIVDAHSIDDVVFVLKDPMRFPPPVRAVGSNHSTTPCGAAEGGTLVRMKMNAILRIGGDTLTVEAGATHLEMARALEARGLQFYVNTEIGSLSAGSAALAGTKDASFSGEYGQVGSYIVGVKLVLPSGDLLDVTDAQPELMQLVRSSYGTFGIACEVTYRVRPLTPMAVRHETYGIDDFVARLPELKARNESMMYYLFPFENLITIEFRRYNASATGIPNRVGWAVRNHLWGRTGPRFVHDLDATVGDPAIRYGLIDHFNAGWRFTLENVVRGDYTLPPDQIIDYPPVSDSSRYTFSLFAFPEDRFPETLRAFVQFSRDYYQQHGYRVDLLDVGYRISQDQQALLSYSFDGPVMTIDPVSTGNPGWPAFLDAYNQFSIDHGGCPLLNQTHGLTSAIAAKALGDRLERFSIERRKYDPTNRLLNDYFKKLLGES